ncbi:hypothetical protein PVAP13_9NG171300 [Panicum virgatum]|uniref:Uncharacterized protein n=1 Tax=Panicum virgatum TaxID=38727 RepID=A0A8T0MGX4_PANVG|nr:hypothetical protein PVAP13_9NG171300 [Panicum virgatum]
MRMELLMLCTKGKRYEIMNVVAKAHMITVILVLALPQPHERLLHYHRYPVPEIYEALSLAEQAGKSISVGEKTNEKSCK